MKYLTSPIVIPIAIFIIVAAMYLLRHS